MSLLDQLKDARIVMVDDKQALALIWYGGHGVHVYDECGKEVSFWNTGNFQDTDAKPKQVRESMERAIAKGEYP